MAMIRFKAFTPKDLEIVQAHDAAVDADPDAIPADLVEAYRVLVHDNFGKLMSTMIGEIARFFDITIKRKYDWHGYYGWLFGFHDNQTCWYGVSYRGDRFAHTCFAVKCGEDMDGRIATLIADHGFRKEVFGRDNSEWVVKEFENDPFPITDDDKQMEMFSKLAEDQLEILEEG